jgi:hypothetical protein
VNDRRATAFALAAALWLLALELLGIGAAIAYLIPALLVFLPLVGGRYPGDEALLRSVRARGRQRTAGSAAAFVPAWDRQRLLPRGGRLISAALAGRGPPDALMA